MSYQIVDEAGHGADFATNAGLRQLRAGAGPALLEFLDAGEADAALCARVEAECRGHPQTDYIARLLADAEPPVTLTQ